MNSGIWPTQVRLVKSRKELSIGFESGEQFFLSAEYLRVFSPSAEVQGHHPSQKVLVTGKAGVAINALESVGNYALRILFDDGHDSGIYSWTYLHELGQNYEKNWQDYRAALDRGHQAAS